MNRFNLEEANYAVNGLAGYTLTEALRLWKAQFETVKHFRKDVIKHPSLEDFGDFVGEVWDTIQPVTVQEALVEPNLERRRILFDCIGVTKLFSELGPELLDRQTISKVRTRWDEHNTPYEYRFEDTYELYELDGEKLFPKRDAWNRPNPVFAVRCWCTTTGREYWIYVREEIALNRPIWDRGPTEPDAVRAIAWTIRIDITDPKRIFRQGDIIIVQESETSVTTEPYHLTKEQYLDLMYSET